ncbi:hypothetical protein [Streptomyces hydrogenans]|uniref:hypothetical protein n=1 Tax=Streptomyces hydrogenans TaxID=1873719 RepID=UPI0035D9AFF2
MNPTKSLDSKPAWVPEVGHALRLAGVHFDAVRVGGYLGEEVAYDLMAFTGFQAGPIVREATRERNAYFLLAPGTASAYTWPAPTRALHGGGRSDSYVGIPAFGGMTWPLGWRSLPTIEDPFVEGELLHRAVEYALR